MRARQSSQQRLLLPKMSPLNKLPPPKVGNPLEVAMTGAPEVEIPSGVLLVEAAILLLVEVAILLLAEVAILSGVLLVEAAILSGVLEEVVPTGPPLPLPLPPPRMPKNLPIGLNAVPGTVRRKSQTTR